MSNNISDILTCHYWKKTTKGYIVQPNEFLKLQSVGSRHIFNSRLLLPPYIVEKSGLAEKETTTGTRRHYWKS